MSPAFRFGERFGLGLLGELAIVASFKTPETMFAAGRFEFTLQNDVALMGTGFWRNILNSLVLCLVSVAISTVLAVDAAYAFSRLRFRAKRSLFASALFGQTVPWIVLVTQIFILCARLGLLNNPPSMVFVYVAVTMPLALYAYFGENVTEWGNVMAASVLTTFPTLLLFLPLQSRMVSGLSAGSAKQ